MRGCGDERMWGCEGRQGKRGIGSHPEPPIRPCLHDIPKIVNPCAVPALTIQLKISKPTFYLKIVSYIVTQFWIFCLSLGETFT